MRIIVNGQQAFGKAVLDALIERGEDVIAVYGPADKDGRVDPLTQAARDHGLPVYSPKSFKTDEVVEELKALKPDLGVMAFVTKFCPSTFLDVPTHGTIQYHPSLLPLHRGPSSINWPIIMGRTETGLSIFWPDDGLDEGPILLQKTVAIEPDDTLGTVYFNKLFPLGVEAMLEAVDLVRDGKAPKIEQDHSKKTYESWCKKEDVELDWSKPASEIYNMIRGANPSPGAWTTLDGKTVQIFDAARSDDISGAPGEAVAISDDGISVAASGGGIVIKRVRYESKDKIPASDFVSQSGLQVGARLGTG
jgi:methionyl-tRNA formyltransferase